MNRLQYTYAMATLSSCTFWSKIARAISASVRRCVDVTLIALYRFLLIALFTLPSVFISVISMVADSTDDTIMEKLGPSGVCAQFTKAVLHASGALITFVIFF